MDSPNEDLDFESTVFSEDDSNSLTDSEYERRRPQQRGSAAFSEDLGSNEATESGYARQGQQQQQQQLLHQQGLVGASKTSSGDQRSTGVQRLVDLQQQSRHLSRLLVAKKQDFDTKMENLRQRREHLQSEELLLKKKILHQDKYIIDNETRRTRALKKAKDNQEMCKVRDKEIERLRSELQRLEQHRARLLDQLSKQSIFEKFLTQVMALSTEFIDIRSIISRYHTLKQLYEDLHEKQLRNEELLKEYKDSMYELMENHNTRVLHHNIDLADMQARFDRAHSRVVDGEAALVRLDAEVAAKTIMFGNIVTVTTNIYRMVEANTKKSMRPVHGKKISDPIQQLDKVYLFLINLQELLKGAEEMGYRRRAVQKSSVTISLI